MLVCQICSTEGAKKEGKYYIEIHEGRAAYMVCYEHLKMLKRKRALSFMQNWADAERSLLEWQMKSRQYLPVKH